MQLLEQKRIEGEIRGLNIAPGKELLVQMFMDDTCIFVHNSKDNYNRMREVIREYELCSGAKLNTSKSEFIPLSDFHLPDWIHNTGCRILRAGEVTKYLRCPIGLTITLT